MDDPELRQLDDRFNRHRAKMLRSHAGKWALFVRGFSEPDFFDSQQDAVEAGYWQAGGRRFLVKQVLEHDPVLEFSRVRFAD